MKKIFLILSICLVIILSSCQSVTTVTWLDADQSVLYLETFEGEELEITEKPLPQSDDSWDYIGWKDVSTKENEIVYIAEREARDRYLWRDKDGTVIKSESLKAGSALPTVALPTDTEERDYTEWSESVEDGVRVFTANWVGLKKILWKDYDGTVLYTVYVRDGEETPERFIPNDTVDRHYTGWKETDYGFVAEYEKKTCVYWVDADGTTLFVDGLEEGDEIKMRPLPTSKDKWSYKEWEQITAEDGSIYFYARADLNENYFKGNICKIIARDINGNIINEGSGFVFNKEGWIITASSVIKNAAIAEAVFDLTDFTKGTSTTTLNVSHVYVNNEYKGFFIGKLNGYDKIASSYKEIPFASDAQVGDTVYTVGFPKSKSSYKTDKGNIVSPDSENAKLLKAQLSGGSSYLFFDAESDSARLGGLLVNEKLEMIGLICGDYSLGENIFLLGGAIESSSLQNSAKSASLSSSREFITLFAGEHAAILDLYMYGSGKSGWIEGSDDDGAYRQYTKTEPYSSYTDTHIFKIYSNGKIVYIDERKWNSVVDISTVKLYGDYKGSTDIDHFTFEIEYMWSQHTGFWGFSDNINYNKNVDKTLSDCVYTGIGNIRVTDSNKNHARTRFNQAYSWLTDFIAEID